MASGSTIKLQNWLVSLGQRRKEVGIGLVIVAVTCAAAAGYLAYRHSSWPELSWGEVAALGFACAGAAVGAVWCLVDFSLQTPDEDHGRLTVAFFGSFLGLGLLVLSALRTIKDWKVYLAPGLDAWQGKEGWHVWVCLLSAVGGLAILFLTITLIRADEYRGRYARVTTYGYTAVQSCLMLLGVLVFVNVLAYFLFPKPADWTASGMYTLNEQSQAILKSLKQPVKIYYLSASRDDDADIELLLNNCQSVTDKVQTEIVLRDRNIKRMAELREKYQLPLDSSGLLVTYETSEGKSEFQFVRVDEMYEFPKKQSEHPQFKGEGALMTAIDYLTEGKSRATVYFTQGNGELDITGAKSGSPENGGASLAERLRKANYDVKPLQLGLLGAQATVPDDAAVVVVAGPTRPLSEPAVEALRKYMSTPNAKKKKGRLIVLAGAEPESDGKGALASTGLEPLLAEYSVELTKSRVLQANRGGNPVNVLVFGNPSSRNPVAKALVQDRGLVPIPMTNARIVRRGNPGLRGGPAFQAEEMLVVPDYQAIWPSESMNDDSLDLVRQLRTGSNEERKNAAEKLEKKISQTPLPVGVAVTESEEGANPMNPHAPGGESTPRLVVIGNARFVSDEVVSNQGPQARYSFAVVSSSLAWLREKPTGIGIPPADRKSYQMSPETNVNRMIGLPLLLMIVTICGLGVATWVVRRR